MMLEQHIPQHPLCRALLSCLLLALLALLWSPSANANANANPVQMQLDLSHPLIMKGQGQRLYIQIGLKGGPLRKTLKRAPINLAVVLDRSTSMTGIKLQKAKEAAKMVLELLEPSDVFSLISYDSTVEVLVPATRLSATTKLAIGRKIDKIYARGMTALFGGVSKGITEVRKFLNPKHVNRVVLLSDGQANIGPSSPNALGRLGAASARQGISISTIGLGLGYNEDLMTRLALKSDGNHGFAKNAMDLQRIFRAELGNVLSVVAQSIDITVTFGPGVQPRRVLDSEFKIYRKKLSFRWNQLYSNQHKFVIVEVDLAKDTQAEDATPTIASVAMQYTDMQTNAKSKNVRSIQARRVLQAQMVKQHLHRKMLIHVSEAIGNETARTAMKLRDSGKITQANKMLLGNYAYLQQQAKQLGSRKLMRFSIENKFNATQLKGRNWNSTRKGMRKSMYKRRYQTTY